MGTTYSITDKFGKELATLLADKIKQVCPGFPSDAFISDIHCIVNGKSYTQRVEVIADRLRIYLPEKYTDAVDVLMGILGPANPNETGMFTHYYWVLPIGKFVEKYGLEDFQTSMDAIAEITKRNTGEYAVRPYIRKYPDASLAVMKEWAQSTDFHLRRLASEGLRPKLPWAPKLDTFIQNPDPVFGILELLKEDEVKFVKKSVANHLTDWLKVNREAAVARVTNWSTSDNPHTRWIVKHATRKLSI